MPKLRPIVLSAHAKSWRMLHPHADEFDKRYLAVRHQVLKRDGNTCAYCGFAAGKYQEVHHLDDDHSRNAPDNLVTACPLCHMCFHLGMAGVKNAGVIIWCPKYTQAQLNNIVRAIFVAVEKKGTHEEAARTLYNSLETLALITEEQLGKGASQPASFGQGLLNLPAKAYASRGERLHGFRLLPRRAAFLKQIAYWSSERSIFGDLPDASWGSVLPVEPGEATAVEEG